MFATKRHLEVLQRRGRLAARTDLPRSKYGKSVYGARKRRFAMLEAEREAAREQKVEVLPANAVGQTED